MADRRREARSRALGAEVQPRVRARRRRRTTERDRAQARARDASRSSARSRSGCRRPRKRRRSAKARRAARRLHESEEDARRTPKRSRRCRRRSSRIPCRPTSGDCSHCGEEIKPIGKGDRSVEYEWMPGDVERRLHVVEVGRCPCKMHYARGPAPRRVQEGCTYGPAFLAKLAVDKCADSTPIYRVEKQMRRMGIPISRSTLNDNVLLAADVLLPLWQCAHDRDAKRSTRAGRRDELSHADAHRPRPSSGRSSRSCSPSTSSARRAAATPPRMSSAARRARSRSTATRATTSSPTSMAASAQDAGATRAVTYLMRSRQRPRRETGSTSSSTSSWSSGGADDEHRRHGQSISRCEKRRARRCSNVCASGVKR